MQHFFNLFLLIFIIRSGIQILSDHPRLYWTRHSTPPTRTRGVIPWATGTDPAQVVGSTTSSPMVSCDRKLATASGVTSDDSAEGTSLGNSRGSVACCWPTIVTTKGAE
ncbi:MAG: hypothetical protein ACR2P2_04495 [Nakamurella sp.]